MYTKTYCEKNKGKISLYQQQHYKNNKTKIQQKHSEYYQTHKDDISERCKEYYEKVLRNKRQEKVICECGMELTKGALNSHRKTQLHQQMINDI